MSFDLNSIKKEQSQRAPRIVLLGVEKIGKSTFAADSNSPIFIPIKGEEGIDDLDVPSFPRVETFDDLREAIGSLYEGEHEYQTLIIDSATALEAVIWESLCKERNWKTIEDPGYGKGYIEAAEKWRQLMEGLDALRSNGMAVILIGHVKVKRFDDPLGDSFDQYQFDLHERVQHALNRWADSILFANTKTVTKKEEVGFGSEKKRGIDPTRKRFLYTQKAPGHPGGGRGVYGRLPYELELSWAAFEAAILAASEKKK